MAVFHPTTKIMAKKKRKELNKYCKKCLEEHKDTWYVKNGKVFLRDVTGVEDIQVCSLIKDSLDIGSVSDNGLTKEEVDFANFLFDENIWTKTELGWEARWYQEQMLKCTALRKVSRCGRRIGKTEAICIKMLHYAYTHEDIIVLVIAPYKNQVGLIFDKLDTFLGKSDSLTASIKQNTKNPYRVVFHNGSRILGFTSGTRTGSKSTGIRGQDAHMILIDEADYLSDSDFDVILAIQASRPDVILWASSTPTGKRDMFWRFCHDKELGFKEFHFKSSQSPAWTKATERLEKAQYSDQSYAHEFDAEFGDEAEGVFLEKFVNSSLQDYVLSKTTRNPESLYTFGVDWNTSENGTCIVITEWNKNLNGGIGAFRTVRKIVISQAEFTQVRACEEIIDQNAYWNPAAIYVDEGYGATQIEMLRKFGLENPRTGLANKVKGIYFGDRIEIRDPVTKQKVRKHIKPFMVNICARRMEDGQIIFPKEEDLKRGLVGQVRDYTVIRRTALGQPIYSDENEHTLIAWMLSVFAATAEFSDIARQNRAVNIGLAGRFGEKESSEFKVNKKLIQDEKKNGVAVTPRWFNSPVFGETTLRNGMDYSRKRNSYFNQKNKDSNRNRRKLGSVVGGRANF